MIHQTPVGADEGGTQAAASAALVIRKGPPVLALVTDHPFLLLIGDEEAGSILFMGRVANAK